MNNRAKGSSYEQQAASFFENLGCKILERNYRRKTGEIDLIVRDGNTYVFVEVKYRKNLRKGYPESSVSQEKQRRIIRTAQWYLAEHGLPVQGTPCRFDVISILDGQLRQIRNAFGGF